MRKILSPHLCKSSFLRQVTTLKRNFLDFSMKKLIPHSYKGKIDGIEHLNFNFLDEFCLINYFRVKLSEVAILH